MHEEYLHLSLQLPSEPPGGTALDVNHLLAASLAVRARPGSMEVDDVTTCQTHTIQCISVSSTSGTPDAASMAADNSPAWQ